MKITTIKSSSSGCCYIIESCGEKLVLDCGIPLKQLRRALDFSLSRVVGCLITHEHRDHCSGANEIVGKTAIPTFGTPALSAELHGYGYTPVHDGFEFECGQHFLIKAVYLPHDAECYGYIIQAAGAVIFYATDTVAIDFNVPGVTHLMIEANHSVELLTNSKMNTAYINRVAGNHLSIEDAVEFAGRHLTTLKEVHLLHLSDAHSDERGFLKTAQRALGVPVYIAPR